MKPWMAVIAFVVLGCGVYLLYATGEEAAPSTVSIHRDAPARSRTSEPATIVTTRPARLPVPIEDERAGPAGPHATEDPVGHGSAATTAEMRDHIEASFVASPLASTDLTRRLESGVRAALPTASSVRSIECRGSLCRVETVHARLDEFRDFVKRAFQDTPPVSSGPVFVSLLEEPASGRPVVAVAYIGSDSTALAAAMH